METFNILKSGLVVHITGIVIMVGTLFASFLVYRQFWKLSTNERDKATVLFNIISRFQVAQMIGGVLVVTGGITMMIALHGVLMHAAWFKIKMIVLLLIILNAVFIARPALLELKQLLALVQVEEGEGHFKVFAVKRKITVFHALQFIFFLAIFILSAFQFN